MPRIATVRDKSTDQQSGDLHIHLETDNGLVRVVAPLRAWLGAEVDATLEVPDGDLTNPTVSAGIKWPW